MATAAGVEQYSRWAAEALVGQTYEVSREGHGNFTLKFLAEGRLVVDIQGQEIQEAWQPSRWKPSAVILGGHTMPAAEVVITRRFGSDGSDLWEPSPPMGAPPLVGTLQRNGPTVTNAVVTKLEMIVDRSGSMQPLHSATVQGLSGFLDEQRSLPHASATTMRLVVFDHETKTCWGEGTPLSTGLKVTREMVQPRGQTALLDAIGSILSSTHLTPARVVCIVTDGHENSSTRFTRSQVNDLITARKNAG